MAKIIVADDAMFMRATLKKTLTEAGHEVIGEAGNGAEAVALFEKVNPDLLLMDITMPEMDGLAALATIMGAHPEARIIMCTALGQENKVKEALAAGARDYVVKPFQGAKLLDAVTRALS